VKWLVAVARHKLVDSWRRAERDSRLLTALSTQEDLDTDPWDDHLDVTRARDVLRSLGGHHRAALSLRYLDGLDVSEVAAHLGRTVQATEALLVRARRAFRRAYEEEDRDA
jgi:RNA polymerase sigma-70 factor (ECF subfamily)